MRSYTITEDIGAHPKKHGTECKKPEQEPHICSVANSSTGNPPQREQKDQQKSCVFVADVSAMPVPGQDRTE